MHRRTAEILRASLPPKYEVALVCRLLAEVGLESVLEQRAKAKQPKANPFDVVVRRVDVPTAPPGGIFEAACAMSEHLQVRAR